MVHVEEVWTLQRSTTDGKLAGVCAAVAARFGVDPLLVRIVCVLLALSAGIGLALYAAAWLLLPADNDPVPVLHRAIPASEGLSRSTLTVAVVVWTVLVSILAGRVLTIGLGPVLVVAALWWFGVLRPKGSAGQRRGRELPPPPASERDFVQQAQAWRSRVEGQVGDVDWRRPVSAERVAPTAPAVAFPPAAQPPSYTWQPAPWAAAYEPAAVAPEPATYEPVGLRTEAEATPSTVLDRRSTTTLDTGRRRRRILGVATLLATLGSWLTLGALGVASAVPYAAAALLAVGLGLIAATWVGRPKGLLPWAVVLLLVTLVSLAPAQSVGELHYRPADAAALPETISTSVGSVVVDLSDLNLPANRTVVVTMAAGEVRIVCPESVNLVVESRLGPGTYSAPGESHDGPGSFTFDQQADPSKPTLTISVELGVGDVEVRRA